MEWIFLAASLAVFAGSVAVARRRQRRRSEELGRVATDLGFQFAADQIDDVAARFGSLPLFERGRARRARNVITGTHDGTPVVVMDYRFVVGSGKNRRTRSQTVALFATGRHLPSFQLGPENVLHKLGQLFGFRDIDFARFPEFSRRYLLRGEDEHAIESVFSPSVLEFFERHPGWSVEGRGRLLAVFRSMKHCPPDGLGAFLGDTRRVADAVRRR
jgi:hypothetical protein